MQKSKMIIALTIIVTMTAVLLAHIIVCGASDHDHDASCGTRTVIVKNKDGSEKIIKEAGCEG